MNNNNLKPKKSYISIYLNKEINALNKGIETYAKLNEIIKTIPPQNIKIHPRKKEIRLLLNSRIIRNKDTLTNYNKLLHFTKQKFKAQQTVVKIYKTPCKINENLETSLIEKLSHIRRNCKLRLLKNNFTLQKIISPNKENIQSIYSKDFTPIINKIFNINEKFNKLNKREKDILKNNIIKQIQTKEEAKLVEKIILT